MTAGIRAASDIRRRNVWTVYRAYPPRSLPLPIAIKSLGAPNDEHTMALAVQATWFKKAGSSNNIRVDSRKAPGATSPKAIPTINNIVISQPPARIPYIGRMGQRMLPVLVPAARPTLTVRQAIDLSPGGRLVNGRGRYLKLDERMLDLCERLAAVTDVSS
jgi:hypothetical protein